jgi:hypothetical protein
VDSAFMGNRFLDCLSMEMTDTEMLDWLEQHAEIYLRGEALEFRFAKLIWKRHWRHKKPIRDAIRAAVAEQKEGAG